jgi:hypothetical protein
MDRGQQPSLYQIANSVRDFLKKQRVLRAPVTRTITTRDRPVWLERLEADGEKDLFQALPVIGSRIKDFPVGLVESCHRCLH